MDVSFKGDTIFALDIGTRTVIGAVCKKEGSVLKVIAQSIKEHDSRSMIDGQVHDIDKVSEVVAKVKKELEEKIGFELKEAAIAAAGRTLKTKSVHVEQDLGDDMEISPVIINSLELSGVSEAGGLIRGEMRGFEDSFYCVGYSIVSYYLNSYPITNLLGHSGRHIGADVLATFLPQSVVSSLYKVLEKCGLSPMSLTLEPIAALEAVIPENIRLINIALVDIGAGTSDIAITRKGSISAYGMVSVAGDEITEAIADEYIVDFNTAELVKRDAGGKKKKISFKDITGTKIVLAPAQILKTMEKAARKLAGEISRAVLSLNGDAPRALFCVGGGSQTPGLIGYLSEELKMDKQRIAVKKRDSIVGLEVCDHTVDGPEGVTVIGIAIVAFKKVGHDFINVYVNDRECRLFNSGSLTICDVLGLIGYNPSALIGRSGRSIRFQLNGEERKAQGEPPTPPEIHINNSPANLDSKVVSGDYISIKDALNGKAAATSIKDYMKDCQSISFSLNGVNHLLEPECSINGKAAEYGDSINDGDMVFIKMARGLKDQAIKLGMEASGKYIKANGKKVSLEYIINDGDAICISDIKEEVKPSQNNDSITVTVNGGRVVMPGKNHIFIDIFNFIDLDISSPGISSVKLSLNGKNAEFSQAIKDGDIIEININEKAVL